MAIIKAQDFVDVYRHKAKSTDLNELSGRTGRPDVTQYVAKKILEDIDLRPGMRLVDIGCGDASLLKEAAQQFGHQVELIGIVPTQEEADKLIAHLAGLGQIYEHIQILKGDHEHLPLTDSQAQRVVANGTLILIPQIERIECALAEMARIADKGALIYVGEIPKNDELADRDYDDSVSLWLLWTLRKQGIRAFWLRLKQTLRALISQEPFVIAPKKTFFSSDQDFVRLLSQHSLTPQKVKPHAQPGASGMIEDCRNRMNYWAIKMVVILSFINQVLATTRTKYTISVDPAILDESAVTVLKLFT